MTPRPLTDRQQRVLDAIQSHVDVHSWPPSIRELCDALGYRSTNAVSDVLKALERKGFITRNRARARSIRVLHS